ncbi:MULTISPECIES: QueT transporter family protein [unclassified Enterococcus]|uniref:QueT transporter family protein n=1 Tax=unclassified Enterococcus TaxID=2608891 RepID=UPI0015537E95|nr:MULTISPECIES: QueT transporter family protein [unclassified Enterococcus]MBS7577776.1 QueT transporter family protein [Enterococcus sp. MMGLQ5-2]MBS7585036.1 QueT transporter family protein [Enterococcus sp. MMGLQ5-1]NPD12892.1 QueT transporter family protein [Enterococcus sp. MMGLQ5-1]NPD37606.1 QueT transporter family protein [Enterococcus sp. MMGLQ5-2]
MNNQNLQQLLKMAIVTALYVVITIVLAPISYGMIQIRLSESFNHLVLYNKKYLYAITLGVCLANFYQYGLIDVLVGGSATFIFLSIALIVTKNVKDMWRKQLITSFLMAMSMFTIALELKIMGMETHGFWLVFLAMALGEFIAMIVGSFIIRAVARVIDFKE